MADLDGSEVLAFAVELDAAEKRVPARAFGRIRHWTTLLGLQVKRNASGRPGPNMVTGDYNRTITTQVRTIRPGEYEGSAFTNAVQGPRLEYGFYGMTDRLGRTFYQPPYAHFRPAFDQIAPMFVRDLETIFGTGALP